MATFYLTWMIAGLVFYGVTKDEREPQRGDQKQILSSVGRTASEDKGRSNGVSYLVPSRQESNSDRESHCGCQKSNRE